MATLCRSPNYRIFNEWTPGKYRYLIRLRETALSVLRILVDRSDIVTDGEGEDGLSEALPLRGPAAGRALHTPPLPVLLSHQHPHLKEATTGYYLVPNIIMKLFKKLANFKLLFESLSKIEPTSIQ